MITIKEAEEILKKEYHVDNFLYVVDELLLPDFRADKHDVDFKNTIFTSVQQLGYSDKCDVNVYEVILNEGAQNRRVTITQEMFRILRGLGVNNAIVAFSNADRRNYRFSLLTSKYEFDGEKVVKVLSNPRRYSYSLGYGTKTKTAYDFLIGKGKVNSLDELINRFSVEVVNKQFYNEIALAFTKLVGGQRDGKSFEKELNLYGVTDQNKYAEFAVRLIGRIVFCWFLKEKKSENGIPLIPESMLALDSVKTSRNYYHDTLEPLFFELLNTNQPRRKGKFAREEIYTQIPYLNGGLFSPHADDHYKFAPELQTGQYGLVTIPNGWFEHFYEILGQYNFTVDENTSYDIELSIDPEMLGRIFENLLAEINPETGENAKKSTGSFYTPRDIVDYMVDSSILEHLKAKTGIDEAKLRALISYGKEDDELATFSMSEKKALINALYTVTVLDPACGSGAFPIGMLQKIVYMLQEIDPEANLWFDKATENISFLMRKEFEKKFNAGSLDYIRKLTVIQNSIFGVDIQPIAVEIARLRCFLSLVIEEKVYDDEPNRGINPLPNLDFKFIIANTLVTLPHDSDYNKDIQADQMSLFEREDHISQLKAVREEYFSANDLESKNELKLAFSEIQKEMFQEALDNHKIASARYQALFQWKPFSNEMTDWFDPEWMFGVKDGFDIVIANPPYVSVKGISIADKERFRRIFRSAQGRFNLFTLMIEKGKSVLKPKGILTYIQPEGLFTNVEYRHIRKILIEEGRIQKVVLFDQRVFEAAVDTAILLYSNTRDASNQILIYKNLSQYIISLNSDEIKGDEYLIQVSLNETNKAIVSKLENCVSVPFGELIEVQQGIIYSGAPKDEIFSNEVKSDLFKKCLDGRDVLRWYINWQSKKENKYIEYSRRLHRPREERLFLAKEKILLPRKSTKINCGYDDQQFYALNTAYICLLKPMYEGKIALKYILGLMNSSLMNYYYQNKYLGWQITIPALNSMPIVMNEQLETRVVSIVNDILNNRGNDIDSLERELNHVVYEIYGLTEEEIAVVEATIK